jgi:hypothetical protein
MGNNSSSIRKINFEDMKTALKQTEKYMIINTLGNEEQDCLILNTISCQDEERIINAHIQQKNKRLRIIIYGKNCNDEKIYKKYNQMQALGFYNIFVYTGGLFEWLMLQDIFGLEEFPTTKPQLDFIKYRPPQLLNIELIEF